MANSDNKQLVYSIPAEIEKVSTRKGDRSLVVTIASSEISPMAKVAIMDMHDKDTPIFFFISTAIMTTDQVIEVMPEPRPIGEKWSSSQRLRFSLQALHKAQGGQEEEFEDWYRVKMLELVDHYNKKTNEIINK